jgi:hypothetical protein
MEKTAPPHPAHWLNVVFRAVLAVFGAYGLSVFAGASLVRGLAFASPRDAVAFSLMFSFIVDACAIIWTFAAGTALRAALGLFVPAAVLGAWLYFSA